MSSNPITNPWLLLKAWGRVDPLEDTQGAFLGFQGLLENSHLDTKEPYMKGATVTCQLEHKRQMGAALFG